MPQTFSCTSCGRCCHGLRLSLSVQEAIAWASRGGLVQILCHAAPDSTDISETAAYKRERRFMAKSGDLLLRVQVMLVARFEAACPNLRPDMRCGIYDERPNVCRIYPAEIIPGVVMNPANRLCPPEAWNGDQPLFLTDEGQVLEIVTRVAIAEARAAGLADLEARQSLVALLEIDVAALENEGFVVWTIDRARLISALGDAAVAGASGKADAVMPNWRFMTPRSETAELISSAGAELIRGPQPECVDYLPLYER